MLRFRRATAADCRLLYEWRNHQASRRGMRTQEPIDLATHKAWFARMLEDPTRLLCFAQTEDGTPIGMVRLDLARDGAHLSYLVDPEKQGQGYGSAMLQAAVTELYASLRIIADVLPQNVASRRALERAGFALLTEEANNIRYLKEPAAPAHD